MTRTVRPTRSLRVPSKKYGSALTCVEPWADSSFVWASPPHPANTHASAVHAKITHDHFVPKGPPWAVVLTRPWCTKGIPLTALGRERGPSTVSAWAPPVFPCTRDTRKGHPPSSRPGSYQRSTGFREPGKPLCREGPLGCSRSGAAPRPERSLAMPASQGPVPPLPPSKGRQDGRWKDPSVAKAMRRPLQTPMPEEDLECTRSPSSSKIGDRPCRRIPASRAAAPREVRDFGRGSSWSYRGIVPRSFVTAK